MNNNRTDYHNLSEEIGNLKNKVNQLQQEKRKIISRAAQRESKLKNNIFNISKKLEKNLSTTTESGLISSFVHSSISMDEKILQLELKNKELKKKLVKEKKRSKQKTSNVESLNKSNEFVLDFKSQIKSQEQKIQQMQQTHKKEIEYLYDHQKMLKSKIDKLENQRDTIRNEHIITQELLSIEKLNTLQLKSRINDLLKHLNEIRRNKSYDQNNQKMKLEMLAANNHNMNNLLKANQELRNKQCKGAIIIQNLVRGWMARKAYKKQLNIRETMAIKIQSLVRRRTVIVDYKNKRFGIIRLQACLRGWISRKNFRKKRFSAIKIQAYYKGYLQRKHQKQILQSTIKIQSFYRSYIKRKELKKRDKACIQIQTVYRGYLSRRIYTKAIKSTIKIQKFYRSYRLKCYNASVSIQKLYRGYYVRKHQVAKKEAASRIQSIIRGKLARMNYKKKKEFKLLNDSAKRIQKFYRKRLNRIHLIRSIIKIQSVTRGHITRNRIKDTLINRPINNKTTELRFSVSKNTVNISDKNIDNSTNDSNSRDSAKSTHKRRDSFMKFYLNHRELNKNYAMTVIRIQSIWRGYQSRKLLSKLRNQKQNSQTEKIAIKVTNDLNDNKIASKKTEDSNSTNNSTNIKLSSENENKNQQIEAATKIQAIYRGFLVREHILDLEDAGKYIYNM